MLVVRAIFRLLGVLEVPPQGSFKDFFFFFCRRKFRSKGNPLPILFLRQQLATPFRHLECNLKFVIFLLQLSRFWDCLFVPPPLSRRAPSEL